MTGSGGGRPDIEELIPALYAAFYDSIRVRLDGPAPTALRELAERG